MQEDASFVCGKVQKFLQGGNYGTEIQGEIRKKKIQGEMGFWVPKSYETIPPFPSLSLLQFPGLLFLLARLIPGRSAGLASRSWFRWCAGVARARLGVVLSSFSVYPCEFGVMPVGRRWWWSWSCSLLPAAALLLLVMLRWSKPVASGVRAPATSTTNLICYSLDLSVFIMGSPLSSHRGGDVEGLPDEDPLVGSRKWRPGPDLPRAQHAVTSFLTAILGQNGGPASSTSMAEALKTNCWSSTPMEGQVVRPRLSNGN
jgi:hypothetical protein